MDRRNGKRARVRPWTAAWCCAALALSIGAPDAHATLTGAVSGAVVGHAQAVELSGTVLDTAGGPVSDATVTVVDTATHESRQTVTAATGVYSFTVSPGNYELHVKKAGFQTTVRSGLRLDQAVQVDIVLQLAGITESSEVSATAPLLNTVGGAVATTFSRQVLERTPMSGRSFNGLIQTTPGVVMTAASTTDRGQFSANGQRPTANYYTVDGVSANFSSTASRGPSGASGGQFASMDAAGGTMGMASVDSVEAFEVQTSSFAPEFGRQPGAQVQIRTRSGSNAFHGSAFEYFRHDTFDANDWFNSYRGLKQNPLRSDSFGGTFGGRLLTDRLFFFASHESLRAAVTQSSAIEVPTMEARAMANPALRPYLDAFAIPNGKPLQALSAEFISSWPNYIESHSTSIRLDQRLNDSMTLFGRVLRAPSHTTVRDSGRIMSVGITDMNSTSATVGASVVHNSTMISDVRFNWSRSIGANRWPYDGYGGAIPPPAEFVPATPRGFGVFTFGNSWYNEGTYYTDNVQRQINAVGSVTWNRDRHQLKLGADYRRLSPTNSGSDLYVYVTFPSDNAEALRTGIPPSGIGALGGVPRETRSHNLSVYAQDVWRATSNLTVTYGVRWELNPPERHRDDKPVLALMSADSPAEMIPAPPGTPYYKTTYTSIGPRVGLAWSLGSSRRTVLRTAVGVFHDLTAGGTGSGFYSSNPPYTQTITLRDVPYPSADPRVVSEIPPPPGYPLSSIYTADPNLEPPYSLQWNVSVDRELPGEQAVNASYVAAEGRKQLLQDTFRSPNQYFTNLYMTRNGGVSSYHSLQLQYRKRWNQQFQAMASYTWGHALDTRSVDTGTSFPSDLDFVDLGSPRGNASFDVRHSFNATASYQVPAVGSGWLGAMASGWGVNLVFRARTGSPLDVTATRNLGAGSNSFRVDYVGGPYWIDDAGAPGGRRLNPAAFAIPAELRQGSLGRNAVYGFGMWQPDLSLTRRFRLTEQVGLELRIESFNVVNHPNFANPPSALGSATFGVSQNMLAGAAGGGLSGTGNAGTNPLFQIGGPRSHQIALKVMF
jgi:hypothetical protein